MYRVHDGGLWYDDTRLGPASGLYVDSGELKSLGKAEGVRHLTMPRRIDIVCAAGARVIGVESKRPHDYETSVSNKRLARQIRTLLEVVDVPCLMLRGWPDWYGDELVRLQALGVVILPGPERDEDVPSTLFRYRTILDEDSRARYAAVAGTDKRPVAEPYSEGRFLLNVRGVGPKTLTTLRAKYGTTRCILDASDDELRKDVSPTILRRLREVME